MTCEKNRELIEELKIQIYNSWSNRQVINLVKKADKNCRDDLKAKILDDIYCKNCRFACQASDCECVCHDSWLRKDEVLALLEGDEK